MKVKSDHRRKFSNLSNWNEEDLLLATIVIQSWAGKQWHQRHFRTELRLIILELKGLVVITTTPVPLSGFVTIISSRCFKRLIAFSSGLGSLLLA